MLKTRYPVPGEAPGILKVRGDSKIVPVMTLMEYDANALEERVINDVDELLPHLNNERVTWINIDGLGDVNILRVLGERFNLHPLALEDVLNTGQRAKVEAYDDYLFIVVQMVYFDDANRVCAEQVSMFLGRTFLITLQEEGEFDVFEPVRARLRTGTGRARRAGPDYLAYALLDSTIDQYFPALERVGQEIDKIEDDLERNPFIRSIGSLHQHKRTLTFIRRLVWPLRDVTNALLHEESDLVKAPTKIYVRDCYDHTVQLMDLVESYRDVLSGLMEIQISSVGLRTNEIMRVLTVISSVFIPLTFIAGVYGMNFAAEKDGVKLPWNMPELYQPYGYIGCLLFMLLVSVGQILYFRRKRWF